jgi:hypothetical protein
MPTWKLVLDEDAFHFFASRRADDRRRLLSALEELRGSPYREPDYHVMDSTGRKLSVWARRPFLVTYWLDSFVTEIRLVDIQKVRF